ncbi:MAG: glycosyltransferase [Erysipelotrichales bacterium]
MFSIIIPCYNGEKTIIRCLESITIQTSSEYEIIIINDGSTDNSKLIIEEFINDNPEVDITLENTDNYGHGPARNLGVSLAKYDYIWFVDADDFIFSEKHHTEIEDAKRDILSNNYPDIYIFSVFETDFHNRKKIWHFTKEDKLTTIKKSPQLVFKQNWVWNKVIKKSFLVDTNAKFRSIMMFEDIYYMMPLYYKANTIYITRDIKYAYVKHDEALTASFSNFKSYPKALLYELLTFIKILFKRV